MATAKVSYSVDGKEVSSANLMFAIACSREGGLMGVKIHPSAIVEKGAEFGENVD